MSTKPQNRSADATLNTAPGAAVHRGPMANDHFTQIHNLVVRGKTPIQTRYVGVWGFITSHTEGWRLTEVGIARELGVGRGFVRSALQAIEAAGCLIRTQQRESTGQMSAGVWFVTDLPIQLQQLGITDPDLVNAKVQEAYEAWLAEHFTSSAPMSDNPTSAATCDDEDHQEDPGDSNQSFPSAAPMSSYPTSGKPTSENRTPKKTKVQKTKDQNTNQPSAGADETPSDGLQAGSMVGWSSDEEATTVADTAGGVLLQSYGLVGSKLREWAPVVDEALESLGQTRVERVLVGGTSQPGTGAIVSTRLPSLQGQLSRSAQQQKSSRRVPWCGQCDYPETRQVEDDRDRPQPCPRCHPRYAIEQ